MTMIVEKKMQHCLNVNFVTNQDITQFVRDQGRKNQLHLSHVLFAYNPKITKNIFFYANCAHMTWHHENQRQGMLCHPSDGEAWKHFDHKHHSFASDPRNVRLVLCSDGFNPYIQASSSPHSCWPVIVTPYNLPPKMCMSNLICF